MSADEAAILAANERFYAALAGGDVDAMKALWAESPDVICVHPGWDVIVGRDAVLASWQAIAVNGPPPIQCHGAHVSRVGDTAIVVCHEVIDGNSLLAATNVFAHDGTSWRLYSHHASPVAQPSLLWDEDDEDDEADAPVDRSTLN